MTEQKKLGFDTIATHAGYNPDPSVPLGLGQGAPRGIPVYRTTPYIFKDTEHAANLCALKELGNIYSRIMNPTTHISESRYAQLEGGHPLAGLATASGTNAIFYSIITLAQAGDNIVSSNALYGGTYTQFNDILPTFGIEVRFVDGSDPKNFAAAADENTRAFFCESVSNPSLEIFDIEAIADEAHELGLPLIVDSTFSTPYLTKPFEYGADIIATSATKWIGGHGSGLGGIIVDKGGFPWGAGKHPIFDTPDTSYGGLRWGHDLPEELAPLAYKLRCMTVNLRNLGGCMSPDNAWMFIQGLETLSLRMERHCENAMKVALYLKDHPKVSWVRYPGLSDDTQYEKNLKYLKGKGGALVVFGIKSDDAKKAGQQFIDSLELHSHVANVGDCKSLAIHPASTVHAQLSEEAQLAAGVLPDLVRLSVGIESIDDIIADLEQGLEKVE
uniref:O-acetylhomoserine aminocarboxypropyltransferase n=1 Tax=Grammatophora oceanica TaxID=210454 RepID=A0A7S1VIJ8_9STRA|mmetsp:Transcript_4749/g.6601  ORF Transcript_4749/g.6601 Transcript_4749/m.6601 type:complete len:444 (+) Transcript_4749:366-1697(+)|eukprot:CAMPEP_0194040372 /NCGR_PEP_ID=MMETSP0009_2-20130614/12394_1 /TAXON_ID=210454 /ORGANISM="Grammatophora oceanica, Strain CCMP 410" /LENGTH=443 /DNA_ID=CAMNT_0038683503 /DNA_START=255 /DNA_END=1586 /DNA_ORIENTATION=+